LPKETGQCVICMDDKNDLINLHQNDYKHVVCPECILKLENECPICRQKSEVIVS
jgi:hypothetical protein